MRSTKIQLSIMFLFIVLAAGCDKKAGVEVLCEAKTREAITCDVKQTAGSHEVEACWDLAANCPNGQVVTAPRTCQKVKGGGTEQTSIPTASLQNVENCQGGKPTMLLSNLTIDGKTAR